LTDQAPTNPAMVPVRLCCGQRHVGAACPDGKVMCCICFGRFDVADLHTFTGHDKPSDVCAECGAREEVSIRGN
jgi:hypothetical protein